MKFIDGNDSVKKSKIVSPRKGHLTQMTLIEIIVVVAIIAIVISLIFGGISKAQASARKVQCSSNLRNLGVADSIYISKNSGSLPLLRWFNQYSQITMLQPYLNSPKIFHCPSAKIEDSGANPAWSNIYTEKVTGLYTDYKLNDNEFISGKRVLNSEIVLAIDLDWAETTRHDNGMNLVFGDGRVEFMLPEIYKPSDISKKSWHQWGVEP